MKAYIKVMINGLHPKAKKITYLPKEEDEIIKTL